MKKNVKRINWCTQYQILRTSCEKIDLETLVKEIGVTNMISCGALNSPKSNY